MSAKPILFISHSTGKPETEPECVLARKALIKALEDKGWHVFLDSHSMQTGDSWRTEILHYLAHAQAGILLLNKQVMESKWVKAEALILCFRKSIDPRFPLLPVVLPGADLDTAALQACEPFQLNEIQRHIDDCSKKSVTEFASGIAANEHLENSRNSAPSDVMWVRLLADLLGGLDRRVLALAAARLNLKLESKLAAPAAQEMFCARLRNALASVMHQKQAEECLDAIAAVMSSLSKEAASRIQRLLLAKWVENESARMLMHAVQHPDCGSIFALRTMQLMIADRYKDRILIELPEHCRIRVFSIPEPDGDYDIDGSLARLEQIIGREVVRGQLLSDDGRDLAPVEAVSKRLEKSNRFALGILPRGYADAAILKGLRARFPRIVFLVMTGYLGEDNGACLKAGGEELCPPLTPTKSNQLTELQDDWDDLVDKYFP